MVFPPELTKQLGHYVYLYIDPFLDELFYIGKGVGNRAFQHLSETAESEKIARINEIRRQGKEPMIEILRFGLTETEASLVEVSAIDLIGTEHLTNKVRGSHSGSFGRVSMRKS